MVHSPINAARSIASDATPAYYTPATRPVTASAANVAPAQAALDQMFGYYDRH